MKTTPPTPFAIDLVPAQTQTLQSLIPSAKILQFFSTIRANCAASYKSFSNYVHQSLRKAFNEVRKEFEFYTSIEAAQAQLETGLKTGAIYLH